MRLRVPDEGATVVRDLIRGDTTFRHEHLDDPVIARADGSPLYNLAVAIDDHDAGITHVVRGEDHISNTPKQLLVLEAIGAPEPLYAHLPLLHGADGKKLSKRHGAASVQDLRDAGYLPEAVRNYLALLGWGDADDETLIPTDELVRRFDIARVSKNPARFDEQKLRWMNGRYLRELGTEELTRRLEAFTGREGLGDAVAISEEKVQTLADFWPLAGFIFDGPADDAAAREKWLGEEGRAALADARGALGDLPTWDTDAIDVALRGVVERRGAKPKAVFQPLRVALAGTTISPGIFEIARGSRPRGVAAAARRGALRAPRTYLNRCKTARERWFSCDRGSNPRPPLPIGVLGRPASAAHPLRTDRPTHDAPHRSCLRLARR